MEKYTEGEHFKGINFTEKALAKGEYENCTFHNCTFQNANLTEVVFVDCEFRDCDLSMANLSGTAFRDIQFIGCKMVGLHFDGCNKFLLSMRFVDCQLNLSSFYKLNLKSITYKNCSLREVDFAEANLTSAIFSNCDLSDATFENTFLEKADFRTAYHYAIDPEKNRIRKAKFSLPEVVGLLQKHDIQIS